MHYFFAKGIATEAANKIFSQHLRQLISSESHFRLGFRNEKSILHMLRGRRSVAFLPISYLVLDERQRIQHVPSYKRCKLVCFMVHFAISAFW